LALHQFNPDGYKLEKQASITQLKQKVSDTGQIIKVVLIFNRNLNQNESDVNHPFPQKVVRTIAYYSSEL